MYGRIVDLTFHPFHTRAFVRYVSWKLAGEIY